MLAVGRRSALGLLSSLNIGSTLADTVRLMSHTYKYPRPSLTVDVALVAKATRKAASKLLLIERKHPPCQGQWALPGGFVDEGEPLLTAAQRELQEETSVDPKDVALLQVGAFGDPGRDPRGWTVTVAYAALVPTTELGVKADDDAAAAQWFPIGELPPLAFDHKLVVHEAFVRLAETQTDVDLVMELEEGAGKLTGPWVPPTH